MEWYLFIKFLHVTSAIIWLGGALVMVMLGMKAERAKNDAELVVIVQQVAWAAERVYVPASIATLLFGLITTWIGGLWSELWVILGLVGIVATIGLGIGVLTPRAKRAEAGRVAGGATPAVVAICREILAIAKFDMVLLFTIVADMVLKPSADDWATLLVMALVIVAAGIVLLSPVLRKQPVAA